MTDLTNMRNICLDWPTLVNLYCDTLSGRISVKLNLQLIILLSYLCLLLLPLIVILTQHRLELLDVLDRHSTRFMMIPLLK